MNHYCIKCHHLYNTILEKCPKCKCPRETISNINATIVTEIRNLQRVAYNRGRIDERRQQRNNTDR